MTATIHMRDGYTTTVDAKSSVTNENGTTVLYHGTGQSNGIVAIVPRESLVIFE